MNQKTKKINQYEPRDKAIEIIAKKEKEFWKKTTYKDTLKAYKEYLQKYPDGMYKSEANDKVIQKEKELKEEEDKAIEIIARELRVSKEKAKEIVKKHKKKTDETLYKPEFMDEMEVRCELNRERIEKVINIFFDVLGEAIYRDRRKIKLENWFVIEPTYRKTSGKVQGMALFTSVKFSKKVKEKGDM
jgi:nucleoid DNA-binding protein